jgi:hypothetical protein
VLRLSTAERLAGEDMRLPRLSVWNDATLFVSYTEPLYVNAKDGKHSDELTEAEEMRSRYYLPVLVTENKGRLVRPSFNLHIAYFACVWGLIRWRRDIIQSTRLASPHEGRRFDTDIDTADCLWLVITYPSELIQL